LLAAKATVARRAPLAPGGSRGHRVTIHSLRPLLRSQVTSPASASRPRPARRS